MAGSDSSFGPAILAFAGPSGVGKTTLLCSLVAEFSRRGRAVGVVKHSKGFADPDTEGKDSQRLRQAGAQRMLLGSPDATVAFWHHTDAEPSFAARIALLGEGLEWLLVESYASAGLPTFEVLRAGCHDQPAWGDEPRLVGFVADFDVSVAGKPCLPLTDAAGVVDALEAMRDRFLPARQRS